MTFLQVSKRTSQEFLDRAKKIAYNHKIILIENNKNLIICLKMIRFICFLICLFIKKYTHFSINEYIVVKYNNIIINII